MQIAEEGLENERAVTQVKGQAIFSLCAFGVTLQQRSLGHWQKGDEGSRREGCILHEEGSGREGEKRGRGRATVKPTIEGDAWYGVGKKDDTKEKIAVGRSQCEKRAERLYVEGHETRDGG